MSDSEMPIEVSADVVITKVDMFANSVVEFMATLVGLQGCSLLESYGS